MTPLVWASLAHRAVLRGLVRDPHVDDVQAPERHPDFAEARAYLRAKAALGKGESIITVPAAGTTATRRHMTAARAIVPGRHHAGARLTLGRSHPVEPHDDTRVSA
jgi:hypothetical protein